MISDTSINNIVWLWMALSIPVFVVLQFIVAPFGRHTHSRFGKMMDNTLAWVAMELVSFVTFAFFFISGPQPKGITTWLMGLLWLGHYLNRALIYPFRQRDKNRKMPVAIFLSAVFFNLMNGGLNGYYLGWMKSYDAPLLNQWNFWIGLTLFCLGMIINIKSDNVLINLRKPGEKGYKVPKGFLFKYVSCPNHLGEIIEWTGFAILTFNLASLSFALWTFANLAPRAMAHHKWYIKNFANYPKNRKALIPYFL